MRPAREGALRGRAYRLPPPSLLDGTERRPDVSGSARTHSRRPTQGGTAGETRLSPVAGARERQGARVFECERASPAFGHDWTHNLLSFAGPKVAFLVPVECDDDVIGHSQISDRLQVARRGFAGALVGDDLVGDLLPFI